MFTFGKIQTKNGLPVKSDCFGILNGDFPSNTQNVTETPVYSMAYMHCATLAEKIRLIFHTKTVQIRGSTEKIFSVPLIRTSTDVSVF